MAFKYGSKDITALKFDKPIEPEPQYRYDFNDWSLNTAQPSGGIEVTDHEIIVTKFKPNEPILISNFTGTGSANTPTNSEICPLTSNLQVHLTGFADNAEKFTDYQEKNLRRYWSNVTLKGLWFAPIYTYKLESEPLSQPNKPIPVCTDISGVDGAVIRYANGTTCEVGSDGILRGTGGGYGRFVHATDKLDTVTPDWIELPSPFYEQTASPYYWWGPGACWQLGVILYTSYATDNDGFITLNSPITISLRNLADTVPVNPTSVEGFEGYLDGDKVYDKPKTYANILSAYGFSFKETDKYTEIIQGDRGDDIVDHYAGSAKTAFVISTRDWDSIYRRIRLPEVIDFGDLIQDGFPFKFWATLSRGDAYTHIWDSLVDAFENTPIKTDTFANHLFAKSNTGDGNFIDNIHLTFDLPTVDEHGNPIDSYVDMGSIFDHSKLFKNVRFTILNGTLKSLHNTFRQSSVTGITFDNLVSISDFSGAFEGCAASNFPENVAPRNEMVVGTTLSEGTCGINYAADTNSLGLSYFGCYKDENAVNDDDKYYTATVGTYCVGAFSRAPRLTEIRYILDMKIVDPTRGNICEWVDDATGNPFFNAVFYNPNITTAKIKNLNKGDWRLDGTEVNKTTAGNLSGLDQGSVEYLFDNLFDLKQNDLVTGDVEHFENEVNCFNGWNNVDGQKNSITYICWPNNTATISKTLSVGGDMKVRVGLTNCTLTLNNGGTQRTITGGEQVISLATGSCTFTFTKTGNNPKGSLELSDHFKSELKPGTTSANLYCPASWNDSSAGRTITSQMISDANLKGWNIYVGGTPVSPTS